MNFSDKELLVAEFVVNNGSSFILKERFKKYKVIKRICLFSNLLTIINSLFSITAILVKLKLSVEYSIISCFTFLTINLIAFVILNNFRNKLASDLYYFSTLYYVLALVNRYNSNYIPYKCFSDEDIKYVKGIVERFNLRYVIDLGSYLYIDWSVVTQQMTMYEYKKEFEIGYNSIDAFLDFMNNYMQLMNEADDAKTSDFSLTQLENAIEKTSSILSDSSNEALQKVKCLIGEVITSYNNLENNSSFSRFINKMNIYYIPSLTNVLYKLEYIEPNSKDFSELSNVLDETLSDYVDALTNILSQIKSDSIQNNIVELKTSQEILKIDGLITD